MKQTFIFSLKLTGLSW